MKEAPLCVVAYDRDERPDSVLAEVARRLEAAGARVRGLLQEGEPGDASCCASLFLHDIGTGRRVEVFERRGANARGCRLDPSGLAEAAGWLREAIASCPDILFINRFGRQEADGRGLLDEIASAVMADIPVVIAVSAMLLPAWRAYAGDDAAVIALDAERLEVWCLDVLRQPAA